MLERDSSKSSLLWIVEAVDQGPFNARFHCHEDGRGPVNIRQVLRDKEPH